MGAKEAHIHVLMLAMHGAYAWSTSYCYRGVLGARVVQWYAWGSPTRKHVDARCIVIMLGTRSGISVIKVRGDAVVTAIPSLFGSQTVRSATRFSLFQAAMSHACFKVSR